MSKDMFKEKIVNNFMKKFIFWYVMTIPVQYKYTN